MSKADEFIGAYNKIDKVLQQRYGYTESDSFTYMINDVASKDAIVRANLRLLQSYANLRNAIVHNQDKDYVIADPHDEVVEKIQSIAELVSHPPRVFPVFQRKVLAYEASRSIFDAIKEMTENEFSQMPITEDGEFIGLLNANTITRWFGATENKLIEADGSTIITDTQIRNVLDYQETNENYEFIGRNTHMHAARDYFDKNRNLEALFITQDGNKNQSLLGIITVWDLFEINKELHI